MFCVVMNFVNIYSFNQMFRKQHCTIPTLSVWFGSLLTMNCIRQLISIDRVNASIIDHNIALIMFIIHIIFYFIFVHNNYFYITITVILWRKIIIPILMSHSAYILGIIFSYVRLHGVLQVLLVTPDIIMIYTVVFVQ